jgi:hypothetical protein
MAIEDIKDLAERIPSLQPMLDDEAKTKQVPFACSVYLFC